MARYRRRRFYKRKSGKWAVNIQEVGNLLSVNSSVWSHAEEIMVNPTQQPTFASQTYTIKNVEFSFTIENEDINTNVAELEGFCIYIMFVPQGMNITNDYNTDHPEYIMAYKYLGSPAADWTGQTAQGQQYQPYKVRTRLARKLQTGDRVVYFIKGLNQSQEAKNIRIAGVIRWWTKAN